MCRQVERLGSVHKDVVYIDENRRAEFDGLLGIGPWVYCCGPATDVRIAFEDIDL